jgi:hypothetical protein
MSTTIETATALLPCRVDVPEQQIDDVRRRIVGTRRPSKELVDERSEGVQLAAAHALAEYWLGEYDFVRLERRLDARPQFKAVTDDVEVHFIDVRSAMDAIAAVQAAWSANVGAPIVCPDLCPELSSTEGSSAPRDRPEHCSTEPQIHVDRGACKAVYTGSIPVVASVVGLASA